MTGSLNLPTSYLKHTSLIITHKEKQSQAEVSEAIQPKAPQLQHPHADGQQKASSLEQFSRTSLFPKFSSIVPKISESTLINLEDREQGWLRCGPEIEENNKKKKHRKKRKITKKSHNFIFQSIGLEQRSDLKQIFNMNKVGFPSSESRTDPNAYYSHKKLMTLKRTKVLNKQRNNQFQQN